MSAARVPSRRAAVGRFVATASRRTASGGHRPAAAARWAAPGVTAVVALAGALFTAACSQAPAPPPVAATLLDPPRPLPAVNLVDQAGDAYTLDRLRGRFNVLFFGFTHCPDVCPLTLATLARMTAEWPAPHIDVPQVVFVSVDPGRDDPDRIDAYLNHFDAGFEGATGPREAMQPWLKSLGVAVHVQQAPAGESYSVTHNSTVYVVGPGAELLAVFSPPHDAAVIAADLLKIRDRYLKIRRDAAD